MQTSASVSSGTLRYGHAMVPPLPLEAELLTWIDTYHGLVVPLPVVELKVKDEMPVELMLPVAVLLIHLWLGQTGVVVELVLFWASASPLTIAVTDSVDERMFEKDVVRIRHCV